MQSYHIHRKSGIQDAQVTMSGRKIRARRIYKTTRGSCLMQYHGMWAVLRRVRAHVFAVQFLIPSALVIAN